VIIAFYGLRVKIKSGKLSATLQRRERLSCNFEMSFNPAGTVSLAAYRLQHIGELNCFLGARAAHQPETEMLARVIDTRARLPIIRRKESEMAEARIKAIFMSDAVNKHRAKKHEKNINLQ
jgi:hypothetical protein